MRMITYLFRANKTIQVSSKEHFINKECIKMFKMQDWTFSDYIKCSGTKLHTKNWDSTFKVDRNLRCCNVMVCRMFHNHSMYVNTQYEHLTQRLTLLHVWELGKCLCSDQVSMHQQWHETWVYSKAPEDLTAKQLLMSVECPGQEKMKEFRAEMCLLPIPIKLDSLDVCFQAVCKPKQAFISHAESGGDHSHFYGGASSPCMALYLAISSGNTLLSSEIKRLLNFYSWRKTEFAVSRSEWN